MEWGWGTPFKCPYLVSFDSKKGSNIMAENKLPFTDLGKIQRKNGEGTVRVFIKERE